MLCAASRQQASFLRWNFDDDPRSKLTLVLEGGEGSGLLGLLGGGKGGSTGNKGREDSELHLGKNSIRKN